MKPPECCNRSLTVLQQLLPEKSQRGNRSFSAFNVEMLHDKLQHLLDITRVLTGIHAAESPNFPPPAAVVQRSLRIVRSVSVT